MLATFRRSLNTWPARLFFMLLVASFGLWGVADVIRNLGRDNAAASVGGRKIELPELQEAFRTELAQAQRSMGGAEISPDLRRMLALQATQRLVTQIALQQAIRDMGIAVPDGALRQAVFDMPAFRGQDGKFDRGVMASVLRNNGMNEPRFLDMMRDDLAQRQVLGTVRAGAAVPSAMSDAVFGFQQEKRVADIVEFPLAAAAAPPAPTDAQVERWWANHPERYSTPEFRRIQAIVLAPETLEKEIQVTDDELAAAWEQHKAEFNKPERRSVQVILTQDEAQAQALAQRWATGLDWTAMQDEASKVGAAPVELSDAAHQEFPAPELGDAVFASPEGVVAPPVHSALGWHVLKVTKVSGGAAQSLAEAHDAVRARVVAEKAADLIYDRANRLENLLSSGTTLENLPGDLGVAAVTGTLDAHGNTPQGKPAPVPGSAELRTALIQAAFAAKPGEQAKLVQGPNAPGGGQTFFALSVLDITPPAPRPLAEVTEQVKADWAGDQVRHQQETAAAQLLGAVKSGIAIADAATKAGLTVRRLPPAGRTAPAEGMPQPLLEPLFSLKLGQATMVETPEGFVVAVLADVQAPPPSSDPVGYGQVRDALARAVGEDMQAIFVNAVRQRAEPRINQAAVASLASPGE